MLPNKEGGDFSAKLIKKKGVRDDFHQLFHGFVEMIMTYEKVMNHIKESIVQELSVEKGERPNDLSKEESVPSINEKNRGAYDPKFEKMRLSEEIMKEIDGLDAVSKNKCQMQIPTKDEMNQVRERMMLLRDKGCPSLILQRLAHDYANTMMQPFRISMHNRNQISDILDALNRNELQKDIPSKDAPQSLRYHWWYQKTEQLKEQFHEHGQNELSRQERDIDQLVQQLPQDQFKDQIEYSLQKGYPKQELSLFIQQYLTLEDNRTHLNQIDYEQTKEVMQRTMSVYALNRDAMTSQQIESAFDNQQRILEMTGANYASIQHLEAQKQRVWEQTKERDFLFDESLNSNPNKEVDIQQEIRIEKEAQEAPLRYRKERSLTQVDAGKTSYLVGVGALAEEIQTEEDSNPEMVPEWVEERQEQQEERKENAYQAQQIQIQQALEEQRIREENERRAYEEQKRREEMEASERSWDNMHSDDTDIPLMSIIAAASIAAVAEPVSIPAKNQEKDDLWEGLEEMGMTPGSRFL